MSRCWITVQLVLACAVGGLTIASSAGAEPAPTPPTCSFSLSKPELTQVSGVTMVTATVSMSSCTGVAVPISAVACVQPDSGDSAGECSQNTGTLAAQVFAPYTPGTTYVSRGRGCSSIAKPPSADCQSIGPYSATL